MKTNSVIGLCSVAMMVMASACGGQIGEPGLSGEAGAPGTSIVGPPGQSIVGPPGQSIVGEAGSPGINGTNGLNGADGAEGPIACGPITIDPSVYGTACGAGTPGITNGYDQNGVEVCYPGTVQCNMVSSHGLQEVCADANGNLVAVLASQVSSIFTYNPAVAPAGSTCNEDLNCDGTPDNTVGAGTNVALVRPALTYVAPVQNSQADSGVQTFLPGLCRTAQEHCLNVDTWCSTTVNANNDVVVSFDGFGVPETSPVSGNREGVVLSDFGFTGFAGFNDPSGAPQGAPINCTTTDAGVVCVNAQTADEAKMGTECVDSSGNVRLWSCVVSATGTTGVACSGPVQ